jgi:predicted DNA-binding transcriptional regulator AlpA
MTARHSPAVARTLAQLKKAPPTLSPAETAPWLGCSRSTVYEAIKSGTFPVKVVTVNRRQRVLTADLIRFLNGETARSA